MRTKFKTMNMNFTWSTTQKSEKAIRYNDYLYRVKCENQKGFCHIRLYNQSLWSAYHFEKRCNYKIR